MYSGKVGVLFKSVHHSSSDGYAGVGVEGHRDFQLGLIAKTSKRVAGSRFRAMIKNDHEGSTAEVRTNTQHPKG